ncbi:MAG: TIGR00341 family protein [Arcobacteraceae bacterium]|nr:TIGR00341 family protein [Arcobacteraceae bacterium]
MKYIEIIANNSSIDTIKKIAEYNNAVDFRLGIDCQDDMRQIRLLVDDKDLQKTLDSLQNTLAAYPTARVTVMAIETSFTMSEKIEDKKITSTTEARQSLYENVKKNTKLDANYFTLLILSTIVATIGLVENNVAIIIGAMVIAPLLGPNLALSLGTALGDTSLMKIAIKSLLVGIFLTIVLSTITGLLWPYDLKISNEILLRTYVGFDSVLLALASGAAAALALTTGASSVMVGVMVAVAILPPAITVGLMIGSLNFSMAYSSLLLLVVNIVSVNLSSKIVFHIKQIYPRSWFEKNKAKQAMRNYILSWTITLLFLIIIIYLRNKI